VKFLSVTYGDAGHQTEGGDSLARRRYAETQESARRPGIAEYEVLNNHDGIFSVYRSVVHSAEFTRGTLTHPRQSLALQR